LLNDFQQNYWVLWNHFSFVILATHYASDYKCETWFR
jgi:hypothetical protein